MPCAGAMGGKSAAVCSSKFDVQSYRNLNRPVLIDGNRPVLQLSKSREHQSSMHFLLLATDYDGTLAHDGVVDERTVTALERLRNAGRRIILVTGRHLPDLLRIFPRLELFDRVIVENGGLLYRPETR